MSLTVTIDNHVAHMVIDRPERRNAITREMWGHIAHRIPLLPATTRLLILSGAGSDFSAGADIAEFDAVRRDEKTAKAYEQANSDAFRALREAPFPTLAAIRGVCLGGAFGLAAACDLRIATPEAVFAVPAARLGLAYPSDAMADIVEAAGPQLARWLCFSGERIDAAAAHAAGFLMEIVGAPDLDEPAQAAALAARVAAMAASIAAAAPLSNRASKAAIRAALTRNPRDYSHAAALGAATFTSDDYAEGRAAFREKRAPSFTGR